VTGVQMLALDVARLTVTPDFVTSAGGVASLSILDGITERVHVSNDAYGLADAADPMLTPAEPLDIQIEWHKPSSQEATIIECTLDPIATQVRGNCKHYEDTASGTYVDVPQAKPSNLICQFKFPDRTKTIQRGTGMYVTQSDDTTKCPVTHGTGVGMDDALANLRSLGLEQSVLSQTVYPLDFFNFADQDSGETDDAVARIEGKTGTYSTNLPYAIHSTVRNNLINYSDVLKFGLITCSGERCEYSPQSLKDPGETGTAPSITWKSDPFPEGKPYYRFTRVNSDTTANGFWRNCLSGMPWRNAPLIYTGKSGSAIDILKFTDETIYERTAYDLGVESYGLRETQLGVDTTKQMLGLNAVGAISNQTLGLANLENSAKQYDNDYSAKRSGKLLDLAIKQSVVTPTVQFPYNSDIIREEFNNGVLAYRYKYSANDVARIDKLLTMYGYKFTKPLELTDFTNRTYFNFVKCANVSVTGHAKWFNDGIAEQLRGGVRVWHVLPSPTYYTNNPIRV